MANGMRWAKHQNECEVLWLTRQEELTSSRTSGNTGSVVFGVVAQLKVLYYRDAHSNIKVFVSKTD